MISILFIIIAIAFGFLVYRRNAGLAVSTVVGVLAIIICMVIGLNWHPVYLDNKTWMIIVSIYILVASVAPVWILLQPRDYLSSFLLYFMLIECALAIISLCAVGYIWANYASGETVTPTVVFATGISKMLGSVPGLGGTEKIAYTLLVLTVSVFCLTSLDTATRLARYMFQEFWLEAGQTYKDAAGYKKILANPFISTLITVVLGISLGLTGYANIWPLFGAANQLLAALGLLAGATWLKKAGKNNKMFLFPMAFMLIVTITSLCFTLKANFTAISAGGDELVWCYIRAVISALLIILAVILAVDGVKTMSAQKENK